MAFFISAWLTFFFVLITSFFVEAFPRDGISELDEHLVRGARRLKKYIRLPFAQREGPVSLDAIQQIALALSDQRLVTGASIFMVGYARHCSNTQYHFAIAYSLGTTSSTTHQSTFMIVQDILVNDLFKKAWRMVWIVIILALNCAGVFLIYKDQFLVEYGFSNQ